MHSRLCHSRVCRNVRHELSEYRGPGCHSRRRGPPAASPQALRCPSGLFPSGLSRADTAGCRDSLSAQPCRLTRSAADWLSRCCGSERSTDPPRQSLESLSSLGSLLSRASLGSLSGLSRVSLGSLFSRVSLGPLLSRVSLEPLSGLSLFSSAIAAASQSRVVVRAVTAYRMQVSGTESPPRSPLTHFQGRGTETEAGAASESQRRHGGCVQQEKGQTRRKAQHTPHHPLPLPL